MNPPFPHEVTPGWYGKLPGFGDFAGRRLDDAFVGDWDRWLQQGLTRLRQSGDYWLDNYLSSPVWRFALGAQVVGCQRWLGILMPSVDRVGRYFPLSILQPYRANEPPDPQNWWLRAEGVALRALEQNFDAQALDAALTEAFAEEGHGGAADADYLPEVHQSLWTNSMWSVRYSKGLPQDEDFVALFTATDEIELAHD